MCESASNFPPLAFVMVPHENYYIRIGFDCIMDSVDIVCVGFVAVSCSCIKASMYRSRHSQRWRRWYSANRRINDEIYIETILSLLYRALMINQERKKESERVGGGRGLVSTNPAVIMTTIAGSKCYIKITRVMDTIEHCQKLLCGLMRKTISHLWDSNRLEISIWTQNKRRQMFTKWSHIICDDIYRWKEQMCISISMCI